MKAMAEFKQTNGLPCSIDPTSIVAIVTLPKDDSFDERTRIDYCERPNKTETFCPQMNCVLVINTHSDVKASMKQAERMAANDALNESSRPKVEAAIKASAAKRKKRRVQQEQR